MKNIPDYNIEFSHIYADEEFGEEQIKSIEILKDVTSKLKSKGKNFVTCVMIDDFNPVIFKLDDKKVIDKVKSYNAPFDFFAYESKFGGISDKLLKEIPSSKLKLEYFHGSQKEVLFLNKESGKISLKEQYGFAYKHTCALLAAAWTLCRLGAYNLPSGSVKSLENKDFVAKKLITILPKKYEEGEKKVLEIIKSTKFKDFADNIEYIFF